jgi:hypothetical protein
MSVSSIKFYFYSGNWIGTLRSYFRSRVSPRSNRASTKMNLVMTSMPASRWIVVRLVKLSSSRHHPSARFTATASSWLPRVTPPSSPTLATPSRTLPSSMIASSRWSAVLPTWQPVSRTCASRFRVGEATSRPKPCRALAGLRMLTDHPSDGQSTYIRSHRAPRCPSLVLSSWFGTRAVRRWCFR